MNTPRSSRRLPAYSPPATSPSRSSTSIYRRYFTAAECERLDATPVDDLASEINLLRILLARVLAAAKRARKLALETHARILSAFSAAGIVMAALVRLQVTLHDPLDEVRAEIERGKMIGRQRRHVFDYFAPPSQA
jgi:hypothetical protein